MHALKAFFLGALKIAVALVMAVVLLVALGWGVYSVYQRREATRNAALADPRRWPEITIEALDNATLSLTTMWRDDALHYQFRVGGYPASAEAARKRARSELLATAPQFTLTFLDEHGFKVFDHEVPLHKLTRMVDKTGKGVGWEARDQTYTSPDTYRRAASWQVVWSLGSSER